MIEGTIADRYGLAFNVAQMLGAKPRKVKVVKIEGAFVLIEEVELPAHKEYGLSRRWVAGGHFYKVPQGLRAPGLPEVVLLEPEA